MVQANIQGIRAPQQPRPKLAPRGPVFEVFDRVCSKSSQFTPKARLIALLIAKRMQPDHNGRIVAFMGERDIVERSGLSVRSVRRAVDELRLAGVIATYRGGTTRGRSHRCNGFELQTSTRISAMP